MILHPRVLLISPEEERARSVESVVKTLDCEVVTTPDVLSAMAVLKAEQVDLVLLDDCPREFFVTDAVRILKCLKQSMYLPVICLFPQTIDPARRAEVLDAGADDFLMGPLEPLELQARMRKLLSITVLHQEFLQSKGQLENALSRESQLLRKLRNDNRQLKKRSVTDGLTSLYNHRYLMEWLKTEFKITRRYGHPISFVMADLDHFKQVNDVHGHPFGDYVLKEVAVLVKAAARESDLVARYGGEEFAVVLPRSDRTMARTFVDRLHQTIAARTFTNGAHSTNITISLGLATYPLDAEITGPEVLVYLADQALLQAKSSGRNAIIAWHQMELERRLKIRQQLTGNCSELELLVGSDDLTSDGLEPQDEKDGSPS
jgi:diguanylate cyclase (GGDEF)-like protein